MSLWTLCRVWNTTVLLCACHWDTEAGQKEEEEEEEVNDHGITVHIC